MKDFTIILLLILFIIFGLPILSGEVSIPKNPSTSEVDIFLGSILSCLRVVIAKALREFGYSFPF